MNNNIEETMKTIEKMIKSYKEADKCGLSNNDFKNEIKALEYILLDYKKLQEEFKQLDKECSRLEEKEIGLEKENKELKEYLIIQNCEINRLNLSKIRLELSQIPDTTEQYKYLKNEYKIRLERTDLENYKSNYIPKSKIKEVFENKIKSLRKGEHMSNILTAEFSRLLKEIESKE